MVLQSRYLLSIFYATVVLPAWAAPAGHAPVENASHARPVAAAPTAAGLLALEKQAKEAYARGDAKFFESRFSDKLVMQRRGSRLSKADIVKMISGLKCEVGEGWALTEPQMLKINNDAYVISYESNMKGSCTADGKTEKMPSPVRAASVWVRNGGKWQVVFHGENLIVDLKAPPAADKTMEPTNGRAAANANTVAAPAPAAPTADPITDALMAAEHSVWEAWRAHDAKRSKELTAKDIAFVNLFGAFFANKAATIKNWTSTLCEVKSFRLTDGVATSVSSTIGILTLTGTAVGTCGGQDISGQRIYGNSVYVKDGNAWKWAFGFNSPS